MANITAPKMSMELSAELWESSQMGLKFFGDFGSGSAVPGAHWLPGLASVVLLGVLVYHILFFRLGRSALTRLLSQFSWWDYLTTYRGLFCADVQKEIVYVSILCAHHVIGGALMALGAVYSSGLFFTLGAIVSMVDDVHDAACMLLPAWPFGAKGEGRDVKLCTIFLIHHLAATVGAASIICAGLTSNLHVQRVGASLLLAGGCSLFTVVMSRTCDRRVLKEAWQDAVITVGGGLFYVYCRFWVYPCEVLALYQEDYPTWGETMQQSFVFAAGLMTVFNVLIFFDVVNATVIRVRTALRGGEKDGNVDGKKKQ